MATNIVHSVESIEIGAPGADGAMGAVLARITPIRQGSVSLTIPEPTSTDIKAEDVSGVIASLPEEGDAPTFNFESLNMSNETLQSMFGGTIVGSKYSFPTTFNPKSVSVKLVTKPLNGTKTTWEMPLCQLLPSMEVQFVSNDVSSIRAVCKILTPFDDEGNALSPWSKTEVAA